MAVLFLLPSCSDFLNEEDPNKIPVDTYFQSTNDVEKALNGAYLSLRSGYCMGESSTMFTEERSDNTGRLDNQSAAGEPFQFTNFSILPSNTYLKSYWTGLFRTVNDCNFTIKGANEINMDETTRSNYLAQAKFIRALAYFDIVRKWGDAPLVTDYSSSKTDITAKTYRVSKDQVYAQIVKDLEEALMEVDAFIDHALMHNLNMLTIIHGKGTGILRNGIQQHLRRHKAVKSFRLGVYGEGESGVTIVELK